MMICRYGSHSWAAEHRRTAFSWTRVTVTVSSGSARAAAKRPAVENHHSVFCFRPTGSFVTVMLYKCTQRARGHEHPDAQQRQQRERSARRPEERESHVLFLERARVESISTSSSSSSSSSATRGAPRSGSRSRPLPGATPLAPGSALFRRGSSARSRSVSRCASRTDSALASRRGQQRRRGRPLSVSLLMPPSSCIRPRKSRGKRYRGTPPKASGMSLLWQRPWKYTRATPAPSRQASAAANTAAVTVEDSLWTSRSSLSSFPLRGLPPFDLDSSPASTPFASSALVALSSRHAA
ncbi:hypothetical protein EYF80_041530 [Liparis tanakae]|uniref:Uncharacterized protein n=1 Tax=Liparis tanakae TaxID=230148 RepID=A0A4Z2G553_9TELE|nr:hypothetical protein EYF80_041530 [Liparis tanakae]